MTCWFAGGGEEFVLILPNTDHLQAQTVMARLRQNGFGRRPDQAPVTASIGLSELKADRCDDWRKLIEIADRRMYVAKRRGRNQVCDSDDHSAGRGCLAGEAVVNYQAIVPAGEL